MEEAGPCRATIKFTASCPGEQQVHPMNLKTLPSNSKSGNLITYEKVLSGLGRSFLGVQGKGVFLQPVKKKIGFIHLQDAGKEGEKVCPE